MKYLWFSLLLLSCQSSGSRDSSNQAPTQGAVASCVEKHNGEIGYCREYAANTSAEDLDSAQGICDQLNRSQSKETWAPTECSTPNQSGTCEITNTWTSLPCPTQNRLGTCQIANNSPIFYYSPVYSQDRASKLCANRNGHFQ